MEICLGIDLGTTFSCTAYINEQGLPQVIPASEGSTTTPSIIWFDGKAAFVGKKANDRKITPTSPVYEFVKRDIGKPKQINTRYEINGYYYGATGMSAIILRKLKKEAFIYLKKKSALPPEAEEKNTLMRSVITVPAYFGDLQRHETRIAGYAAGLDVIAIINEPTAAALAYSQSLNENKKILVFDLGGGTFDVTILKFHDGESVVIASDGADQLGGKDWDELIIEYIYTEFRRKTGRNIPDDMSWEIQQKALDAKLDLTEHDETTIILNDQGNDVEITLYQAGKGDDLYMDFDMDTQRPFYFQERATNLLSLCRTICLRVIEKAHMNWGSIDDIIMAGGSCRMPMIPAMIEELAGRKIQRSIPGFSYDTAIAIGAAVYGLRKSTVKDVTSKTIGIEVEENGKKYIKHLIEKNSLLPTLTKKQFKAEHNAVLKVYEGDSKIPDLCVLRGRLELGNPAGFVNVTMSINEDGLLESVVDFEPATHKILKIKVEDPDVNNNDLKNKVQAIELRL